MIRREYSSINKWHSLVSSVDEKCIINIPSSNHNIEEIIKWIWMRNNEYILFYHLIIIITIAFKPLSFTILCVSANSSIFILVVTFLASMMFLVSYTRLHNNHYVLTSFLNQYSILTIMIICFCCLKNLDIHKDISIDISVDSCLRHFHCINEQILQEW